MSWLQAAKNWSESIAIAAAQAAQESAIELRKSKINALDRLEEFTGRAPTQEEREQMLNADDFVTAYQAYIAREEARKKEEIRKAFAKKEPKLPNVRQPIKLPNTTPNWWSEVKTPIKAEAIVVPIKGETIMVTIPNRDCGCNTNASEPATRDAVSVNVKEISANSKEQEDSGEDDDLAHPLIIIVFFMLFLSIVVP